MITAVDTNVLSYILLNTEDAEYARSLLKNAHRDGNLMVSPIVFAELIANPLREVPTVEQFFAEAEIVVDFQASPKVWKEAGMRFAHHAKRRKQSGGGDVRRIAADFVIGAHALHRANRLLTFDKHFFGVNFPELLQLS